MATNSTIALHKEDNSVIWIICFLDGYPSHTGNWLINHCNSYQKVNDLILGGNIDSVGSKENITLQNEPVEYYSNKTLLEYYHEIYRYCPDSRYNYLFYKGKWCLMEMISDNNIPLGVSIGAI